MEAPQGTPDRGQRMVTEKRRAGSSITASVDLRAVREEWLWSMVNSVPDAILVADPQNRIISQNVVAERLFNASSGDNAAWRRAIEVNNLLLAEALPRFAVDLPQPGTTGRELALVDPMDGRALLFDVTILPATNPRTGDSGLVLVLRDVTDLRHATEESEKLAAAGRLAAAVAHEINNPMEAIKNALYLVVTSTPESDPNHKFLEIASRETNRVSGIVRQMLGFYSHANDRVATNINKLLEEALELLERDLSHQQIRIGRELDDELPEVPIAPDQIKQVFLNLFLNAKEAMPQGGELRVTSRVSSPREVDLLTGRHIRVQVQDSGQGIAREHMRHLFEPFFSTKQRQRGTGLGLWVSQSIVQQHGGQIQVLSGEGAGATFSVLLPVEPVQGADPAVIS